METLLQIQSQIESQCDTFEKLKDSLLNSVACPEIVCDNFICIMSLLANSRNHIQYEINQKVSLYVNRKRNECSRVQNVPQITLKRKQQEIINDLRTKKVKVCLKKIKLPVKTIESQTKIKIKTEKNVDEDTTSDDMENSFSDEEPIDDMENGFTDENFIEVDYNIIKEEIKIEDNPIEGNCP